MQGLCITRHLVAQINGFSGSTSMSLSRLPLGLSVVHTRFSFPPEVFLALFPIWRTSEEVATCIPGFQGPN